MGQLANPSHAFQRSTLSGQAADESGFGSRRQYPLIGFAQDTDPRNDEVATKMPFDLGKTTILLQKALAAKGSPHCITVQSLLAAISDCILANLNHDDPGIKLDLIALENLRNATAVLNQRDERMQLAIATHTASKGVPAHIDA